MGVVRAIGMMSGTSLDGVDIAALETDGERVAAFGPTGYRPYTEDERALLRRALDEGKALTDRNARPGVLAQAEDLITRAHAEMVEAFIEAEHIDPAGIAIVGFHGQTVLHKPAARLTVQIGDGAALARRIKLPVAYDFRAADVAAGGQGAPLVPVYHQALARGLEAPAPDRGAQRRRRRQRHLRRRRRSDRLRHRPGQRAHRRFHARAHRRAARPRRRRGGARPRRRGFHRARAGARVLRAGLPEIARPQRLRLRQYRACRISRWPTARPRLPR